MNQTNNNAIVPFIFGETAIRTVSIREEPYFVIADVCKILELTNPTMVVQRLHPDDLSSIEVIDAMGRHQSANCCNESGLYALIFQSRKAAAREFTRWVTSQVLPTIRRTGSYGPRSREVVALARELLGLGFAPREACKLVACALPPLGVRESAALASAVSSGPAVPGCKDEDLELLARMDGTWQRVDALAKVTPLGRLRLKSDGSRQIRTRLGKAMARLLRAGLVEKNPADTRHASYRPVSAEESGKIVSMP